jgi:hypothetical protein
VSASVDFSSFFLAFSPCGINDRIMNNKPDISSQAPVVETVEGHKPCTHFPCPGDDEQNPERIPFRFLPDWCNPQPERPESGALW